MGDIRNLVKGSECMSFRFQLSNEALKQSTLSLMMIQQSVFLLCAKTSALL